MKHIRSVVNLFIAEAFIIFAFIFIVNNYFQNTKQRINADGIGYYDYLPSAFIHHDLVRKDSPVQTAPELYQRLGKVGSYEDFGDYKVNRYPCGPAVLQAPFFLNALSKTKLNGDAADGYQQSFQDSIFHAAVFYLFLSLLFFRKVLELFNVRRPVTILSQFVLALGTNITHYVNDDPAYSHIYSLFAIAAFTYFTISWFKTRNSRQFLFACVFFGLVLILRQINVLVILAVPFLAGSFDNLKTGIVDLFRKPVILACGFLIVCGIFSIQSVCWYLQAGKILLNSYQGYGFNFLEPQFFNILFSYKKGLFVYTPVLLISVAGIIWMLAKRKTYKALTLVAFFMLITFVFSSWFAWDYGCSFGLRPYIDFYAILFIPFAVMLNGANRIAQAGIVAICCLTTTVNLIQTYQYKEFILHWIDMDKASYWKVFLRTEEQFKGAVWKDKIDFSEYYLVKEIGIGDACGPMNSYNLIYSRKASEIPGFENVSVVQMLVDNEFNDTNNSKLVLSIEGAETLQSYCWHAPFFTHFAQGPFGTQQTGLFNFKFLPIVSPEEKIIRVYLESGNQHNSIRNVKLLLFAHK